MEEAIRRVSFFELSQLQSLYDRGRAFQIATGNKNQWAAGYPGQDLIMKDYQAGNLYVLVDASQQILAAMAMIPGEDPTYQRLDGGKWLNHDPYVTIHRIVSAGIEPKSGQRLIEWTLQNHRNVRIDTHRDNLPMIRLLDRLGFIYCGIIYLASGDERLAYHYCREGV